MDGIIAINKPKGPTSHDVVARLRRLTGVRRTGHTGTLDPMAEGVLVCCLGQATRVVPYLVGLPKEYTGEMTLGASTDTYDAEGRIVPGADPSGVTSDALVDVMRSLTGVIDQEAPPFSAVKVNGKRLYELARQGKETPRKVRTVRVERFDLVRYLAPRALFVARVGSGTYIRSLVHAVGQRLGCGAYLSALCRTRVGAFHVDDAVSLDALQAHPEEALSASLLSIAEGLAHLPKITISPRAEERLRSGGTFTLDDVLECAGPQPVGEPVLVLSASGEALSIAKAEAEDAPYRPLRVLGAP